MHKKIRNAFIHGLTPVVFSAVFDKRENRSWKEEERMNVLSRTVRSAILIGTIIALQIVAQTYQYPFQNPSLPRETRIADLV